MDANDPVKLYLADIGWLEHEDSFRGLLDQVSAYRKTEEPEVEDYAIAAVGQALVLAAVPHALAGRILRLLTKQPLDMDQDFVSIVNGGLLALPGGLYTLPGLQVANPQELRPLVTTVFSLGTFWSIAKKVLCAPSA